MSDETTATPTPAEEPETAADAAAEAKGGELTLEDYKAELAKVRKEAAKYRTERNELRGDAEKYRQAREDEKTDLEKTVEKLAASEARIKALEADKQRLLVVSRFGIAEDNLDLLGDDPEKFEANAEKIAALQQAQAKRHGPPSEVPLESLHSGASDGPEDKDDSFPEDWPVNGPFA
ncbi:hypothetical protein [Corynebacterium uterequi]|uniref:Scaffolding protein n=1 Tax=Corynebacterium uterequi TaxID=1072256 RepID=A0A0G3HIF9_9CORY|nr:hypothetical protein [Corynebacterium uterequi]AKK11693.1 hypothetical protein CUTER_08555 [Corynebacterium uterequi]